ncbi:MAG: zf-HC2 domain-containing protein [Pyrinomonadaceae bacterium]|nr:zf-HC2 domain-containing protein [Pyrinomonadaceae bacterium]
MNCEETKQALSSYLDDELSLPARAAADEHLRECPLCREELDVTRSLVRRLSALPRPLPPPDLVASINDALLIEAGAALRQPRVPLTVSIMRWLQPRVMPYTVGTFASCLLFILMFTALRSSLIALRTFDRATRPSFTYRVTYLDGSDAGYDITKPITPESLAARRSAVGVESPSLNPNGALAALAWTPTRDNRGGDDDMIVVTDVFSNGRASLADVVQAPRDRRLLDEFQNALREGPAFVPASYDKRPQTMRVVFVLQKISVREGDF